MTDEVICEHRTIVSRSKGLFCPKCIVERIEKLEKYSTAHEEYLKKIHEHTFVDPDRFIEHFRERIEKIEFIINAQQQNPSPDLSKQKANCLLCEKTRVAFDSHSTISFCSEYCMDKYRLNSEKKPPAPDLSQEKRIGFCGECLEALYYPPGDHSCLKRKKTKTYWVNVYRNAESELGFYLIPSLGNKEQTIESGKKCKEYLKTISFELPEES